VREIVFYRDVNGKNPIEEFLDSLSPRDAQKVTWTLRLVEELDVLPKTYFKKLVNTDEIWEVRIRIGRNSFRLLCFLHKNDVVILTNGFQKKTQKTPHKEIKLAEMRRADWMRRNG
jgi:phage-related protein